MAVLIVEDDRFYGNQLAELLSDNGIDTLRARSAEEALQTKADSYDAAIIDVMLPNDPSASGISEEESRAGFLTGVALARRLRRQNRNLRLALITGDLWRAEYDAWAASQGIPVVMKSDGQVAIRSALRSLGLIHGGRGPGPSSFMDMTKPRCFSLRIICRILWDGRSPLFSANSQTLAER